jgi:hypothetical protein
MARRPVSDDEKRLLVCCAPFPLAVLSVFALFFIAGNRLPRQLAPGEGVWLAAAAFTAVLGWLVARAAAGPVADARRRRGLMIVCAITSAMAWPIWAMGVMTSVNGLRLDDRQTTTMRVVRLETSTIKNSRRLNHWARLEPMTAPGEASPLRAGRYFIGDSLPDAWRQQTPQQITIDHARGVLGARVVLALR